MTAPVLGDPTPWDATECNVAWPTTVSVGWTDVCGAMDGQTSGTVDGVMVDEGMLDACTQYRDYTFDLTDDCGNAADQKTLRITRHYDMTAPVLMAPMNDTLCNGTLPEYLVAEWTDNCYGSGTDTAWMMPRYEEEVCYDVADYIFMATDSCGNTSMDTTTIVNKFDVYENCETAFAKLDNEDAHCFIGDYNFNRWGWTNRITEGEYDLPYYAGAGQCDISKGVLVGNVHVSFTAGQVTVEYQMDEGYVLSEAHVYVGCKPYPENNGKPTVAPGQFTYNAGSLDHSTGITVNFTDVTADELYIIVHGVTCEEVCRCSDRPGPDDGAIFDYTEEINCSVTADETEQSGKGNNGKKKVTTDVSVLDLSELRVYPNPFSDIVNIEFVSPVKGHAILEIHNMVGQRVATLMDQYIDAGALNKVQFRPDSEVSGFYLYKLDINGQIQIGKMIYRNE